MACALQNGKGGYGERGGPRGVWEGGGDQAAARPWRAGRRRQCGLGDGSAARREAQRRQRSSEGGAHGDGSAAGRKEARRRQRGSEGGPEVAARFGGRRCGSENGSAVRSRRQCSHSKSHFVVFKMKAAASISKLARAAQGPRESWHTLIMPEGVIRFPFTFTYINY